VPSSTRTRYAKCGDADIAYQVLGNGPRDLLLFTGAIIPIECMDEEPSMARFQRRLASFGRLIRFDQRGVGLSDRGSPSTPPTGTDWVEDALTVLDAVGSGEVTVIAPYLSAAEGITLSARRPDRVVSLVVVNGSARLLSAPDYGLGMRHDLFHSLMLPVLEPDADEQNNDDVATDAPSLALDHALRDVVATVAPSLARDRAFREWFDRAGNLGATPAMAAARWAAVFSSDVRPLLSKIDVPALIIHRRDIVAPFLEVGHGRYLAEHIPSAKYVELSGKDALYWVGDTRDVLDEIEEFVTGTRGGPGGDRVLATILFTDIVGSTDRAAHLGDEPWRDLLDRHDQRVRTQIGRFRGREVNTAGDGFVAIFDSPSRAIECARAIRDSLKPLDIEIRGGIHTGEVEIRGDDIAGLAVHIGARVASAAGPGEVLVSGAVPPLLAGSGIEFFDRGVQDLKGVPGRWALFAVRD
jgi:class 3 adenylate cyclase